MKNYWLEKSFERKRTCQLQGVVPRVFLEALAKASERVRRWNAATNKADDVKEVIQKRCLEKLLSKGPANGLNSGLFEWSIASG